MDLAAMRAFRANLETLSPTERMSRVSAVAPIEIAGKQATLLASPVFLREDSYDRFVAATRTFVDATVAIETHDSFRPGNCLYDMLYDSLSANGKRLVDHAEKPDPRAAQRRFRRLDGYILDGSKPNFIEMNQSAPLAMSFYERARQVTRLLGEAGESFDLYDSLALWFINEAARYSVQRTMIVVAVSMERGYPAKFVDLPVACKKIAWAAKQRGVALEFILAEPTEFCYNTRTPTVSGKPFDILWRNTVYLQNYSETLHDYETMRYGSVPMINDLWSWFFRSKAFFAMIWDDSLRSELDYFGVKIEALREITPETKWLSVAHSGIEKNDWVIKRCDDGFGRGIVFGSELSQSQWQAYMRGGYGNDWVVQRIVTPQPITLPVINDRGEIHDIAMTCDFDPYVVNGVVAGMLVRALPVSDRDKKMNIVEGAAIGHASVRRAAV